MRTASGQRWTMTFLSWSTTAWHRATRRLFRVVRSSQILASVLIAMLVPSCLIAEPPDWSSKPSPPVLADFKPLTGQIVAIPFDQPNHSQTFTFSEVSEDEGYPLRVVWYLNYGSVTDEIYINNVDVAPGHANKTKNIVVDWTPAQRACSSFTIVVTHTVDNNQPNHHPTDPSDVAFVTWLVNVKDTPNLSDFSDCPSNNGSMSP